MSIDHLRQATAELRPPFAVVDLDALRANADQLVRRSGGKPIRLASKSLRCRAVIDRVLQVPGFHGVMAFTVPEAHWLATTLDEAAGDILVGYPCADPASLRELAADERAAARVTLMVDCVEHLDLIAAAAEGATGPRLRVCLDLDASLRLLGGRVHLGMRRSPLHAPDTVGALARAVLARPRLQLVAVMAYEGQIAGVADDRPGSPLQRAGVRAMQRASVRDLAERRAAAVRAVLDVAPLEYVNGGGTGSLESTSAESAVTELAAGSGLYAPVLFDHYRAFTPRPAAYFALTVTRRPAPRHVTVLGGGWIASGPAGPDRLPTPVWPAGLRMLPREGAGEVQTPLTGSAADRLRIGDRVWFRHAKAGELCERVDRLHLVEDGRIVDEVPTYRGEGRAFL